MCHAKTQRREDMGKVKLSGANSEVEKLKNMLMIDQSLKTCMNIHSSLRLSALA